MKISNTLLSLILVIALAFPLPAFAGIAQDTMVAKEKEIRKLLATKTEKGTPAHEKKEGELRQTINELFDFEELGTRSLAFHWEDLTGAQKDEFVDTLQKLIEKNYLLRITSSTTYDLKWYPEYTADGDITIRFKIKSGKYRAAIQFRVIMKENRPKIYDMLIDDVSLLESYRSQFNKIIRKDGYPVLISKMKKKLTEMDAPKDGKIGEDTFDTQAEAKNPEPATQAAPKK